MDVPTGGTVVPGLKGKSTPVPGRIDVDAAACSSAHASSQPSPLSRLPSSHCSPLSPSRIASPQRGSEQSMRQDAFGVLALLGPASHSSPLSSLSSPQKREKYRHSAVHK